MSSDTHAELGPIFARIIGIDDDTTTLGLRDRKKERTRAQLESIAVEMFADRGFDEVTVDEIAAAADVSHRTFYRYFPCKEDVLLGDHQEKVAAFADAIRQRPADESPFEAIHAVLLDFADAYEQDHERHAARAAIVAATPSLSQRIAEKQMAWELSLTPVIAERFANRSTSPTRVSPTTDADLRSRLLVTCAVGAMRVAIDRWVTLDTRGTLRSVVDESFRVLAAGFV